MVLGAKLMHSKIKVVRSRDLRVYCPDTHARVHARALLDTIEPRLFPFDSLSVPPRVHDDWQTTRS
jgi:hypothetical protein